MDGMTSGFQDYFAFVSEKAAGLKGPVAVLLFEDETEIGSTLDHALRLGFRHILALSPDPLALPAHLRDEPRVINLRFGARVRDAHVRAVNALIDAVAEGTWLHYGYNAEYLFYPFSDTRSVGEMLAFHLEERRHAMLGYVIDLYAPDLTTHPDAVDRDGAMFDQSGYYALGRKDASGSFLERQLDFHGGLRWRFEEYIFADRRRIDRIPLFQAKKGLRLLLDHRFNDEEYNTYACPWHHNLTCAMASFRVAKALVKNPGSRDQVRDFTWRNSCRFEWSAQQLMDLGLMEPGQWF